MFELYLAGFCVSLVYVFLKATQQINVVNQKYVPILPISIGMSLCEATIVVTIVKTDITIALAIGLGAGIGAMLSMWFIGRKYHKKGE